MQRVEINTQGAVNTDKTKEDYIVVPIEAEENVKNLMTNSGVNTSLNGRARAFWDIFRGRRLWPWQCTKIAIFILFLLGLGLIFGTSTVDYSTIKDCDTCVISNGAYDGIGHSPCKPSLKDVPLDMVGSIPKSRQDCLNIRLNKVVQELSPNQKRDIEELLKEVLSSSSHSPLFRNIVSVLQAVIIHSIYSVTFPSMERITAVAKQILGYIELIDPAILESLSQTSFIRAYPRVASALELIHRNLRYWKEAKRKDTTLQNSSTPVKNSNPLGNVVQA